MHKEIPILFSTSMVRAIQEGSKTMTRRIVKFPKDFTGEVFNNAPYGLKYSSNLYGETVQRLAYALPDDLMWVKETFFAYGHWTSITDTNTGKTEWTFHDLTIANNLKHRYIENPPEKIYKRSHRKLGWYKRPSLFMPKDAARIWLEVTEVRVERLQDISEEDAMVEGVKLLKGARWQPFDAENKDEWHDYTYKIGFEALWQSINGEESWTANPWVWVISFKVLSTTGMPVDKLKAESASVGH